MSTTINLETGIILAVLTIVFSAGGFYFMGIISFKKMGEISDKLSNVEKNIGDIKTDIAVVRLEQNHAKSDISDLRERIRIIENNRVA